MKDKEVTTEQELVQSIEDQINAALQESQQSKKQKKTTKKTTKKESKKMDTPETPKKEPTIVVTVEKVCDKEESTWQAKLGKVDWIALLNSAGTKIATAVMSLNISILLVLTVVLTLVSSSFIVLVVGLLITLARYAVQEKEKKIASNKED